MNPFTLSFILRVVDSASSASGETHTKNNWKSCELQVEDPTAEEKRCCPGKILKKSHPSLAFHN